MEPNLFRYIWQNSRREQLFVLVLIAGSLPFYWLSLDVPKRIVNEALQGRAFENGETEATLFAMSLPLPDWLGGTLVLSEGLSFDQLGYLLALSFLFLFFVIANGAFKFGINISKGMLAERMLRRMRFELFSRMMRFKPEQIRSVKPAEAASMIKDEVEPIGGFIGDAFIQPAFLGTQALTALIFIMVQSVWLGSVALAIVLVQAFLIPYLRREQLRLGRLRQLASRRLAGRIGEMIDGAPMLHTHGLTDYSEAEIGGRLGHLFDIRAALYKRKFAVKYLNNLLAQITPFFFYAIGGYLALRGSLDIGQLVAVIAAYRDLPPPIKELIDWDQRRADAGIKYEQVITQFTGRSLLPDDPEADALVLPKDAPIRISGLTLNDQRGAPLLNGITCEIPRGEHTAIMGKASSGRDVLVRVLGRQLTNFEGKVTIDGHALDGLSDTAFARSCAFVPPDPSLFAASIRENVVLSLRRKAPPQGDVTQRQWREAKRAANPLLDVEVDWTDYAAAGVEDEAGLEALLIDIFRDLGLEQDIYSYGLSGRLRPDTDEAVKDRLVLARREIRERLKAENLGKLVEPFHFSKFNKQATLGENLLFGVIASDRLDGASRASDPFVRAILAAEALEQPLGDLGLRIAETSVEIFTELPSGHPLFDRFSMVKSNEVEAYVELVAAFNESGFDKLAQSQRDQLVSLALDYVEPKHRLGLVTPELCTRVLRARGSFRRYLPDDYSSDIEFYDRDRVSMAAPLRDNLLFGRVAQHVANADKKVGELLQGILPELGLEELVYQLGLDYDVGARGSALFAEQRAAVSLARSLIRRPELLILEDALKNYPDAKAVVVLSNILKRYQGRTVIVTVDESADVSEFNNVIEFDGPRARMTTKSAERAENGSGRAENGSGGQSPDPAERGRYAAAGSNDAGAGAENRAATGPTTTSVDPTNPTGAAS